MIYLKPGVQVIGNTDGLFELPDGGQFYADENCLCENGNLSNCPLSNPGIKAHFPPCRFNTDMFVFEPSVSTFNALLHKLAAKVNIIINVSLHSYSYPINLARVLLYGFFSSTECILITSLAN